MQMTETAALLSQHDRSVMRLGGAGIFVSYFLGLVLLGLLSAVVTSQAGWGTPLGEFTRAQPAGDPASFASGALDIARHGWITPGNQWLIRLWPPGFMVLEGLVIRLVGEDGPFLVPLLLLSALCCATWMALLRRYLLRSGAGSRMANFAPALPFAFPLASFFLLSPIGLAFGETFAVSLYLTGFMLVLLAFRAGRWWKAAALAAAGGMAIAAAAYFRSQFELLVLFLSLGAAVLFGLAGLAFLAKRKELVSPRVLLVVVLSMVTAHAAMAPWRLHNYRISGLTNWVSTSMLVYENALRPEAHLLKVGAGFVVAGGGHLACKLEPSFCNQKDQVYFYRSFLNHPGEWIAYKVQLLPRYWMAPPLPNAMSSAVAKSTLLEDAANLVLFACLLAGLWRLWSIRREPVFLLQAWLILSLYGGLAAVYTLVHLETRYLYLPKIFSVVALVALLAPRLRPPSAGGSTPAP